MKLKKKQTGKQMIQNLKTKMEKIMKTQNV